MRFMSPAMNRAGQLSGNTNESRLARFNSPVHAGSHHVVAKAAISIKTFLRHFDPVRQERHGDFALGRVTGNEGGDVAFYVGFADGLADVWIPAARHPLAVELHFQFVSAEGENTKIIAIIAIDAVDLSGSDYASRWPRSRVGRDHRFLRAGR